MRSSTGLPLVSVVVRARDEARHIGRLLRAVRNQSYPAIEVILVDSGSTDETIELARPYIDTLVRIPPDDFSFGRALNVGCQHAAGDLLVFASAHVYPERSDWIEVLTEPVRTGRSSIVYGRQRGAVSTRASEHQVFASWFPDRSILGQTHPFCNNANIAIEKRLWEHSRYDEQLPGLEDLAWARVAIAHGARIDYCAEASVIHLHDETDRQLFRRYYREFRAIAHQYPRLRLSRSYLLRCLYAAIRLDLANEDPRRIDKVVDIVRFRVAQYGAALRGLPAGQSEIPYEVSIYLDPLARRDDGFSEVAGWADLGRETAVETGA